VAAATIAATIALWVAALPAPPKVVIRETKSFGTVNIDHAAHLARRAACSACHVSGRVGPVKYETPRAAHEACRGCHVTVSKGPTECRGCHVVGPDAPSRTELAAATPPAPAPPPASGAGAVRPGGPPPPGATGVAPGIAPLPATGPPQESLAARSRTLEIGLAAMASGRQGTSLAPSVTLLATRGATVLSHTLVLGGVTQGRTQFLVGVGKAFPMHPRVRGAFVGMGGVDATQSPVFMSPAVGVRAALELETGAPVVQTMSLSLGAIAGLLGADAVGERSGQVTVSLTLAGGFALPR
jgi:hypothetical protein